jgi:beta-galactosidase
MTRPELERIAVSRKVELGAQVYVNKYDSPERVRYWIRKLHEARLSIARVFIFWDIINPSKDEWYFDPFDALFAECEKLGIKVCATIWAAGPPGWMGLTNYFQNYADLDDTEFWSTALDMTKRVVERYHNHPALECWIPFKEAHRGIGKHPNSLRVFKKYLKEAYGSVEDFNRVHFNHINDFESYGMRSSYALHEISPYEDTLDWYRFSIWNLCEKIRDLTDTIRSIDKVHPIHVNAQCLPRNQLWEGNSAWNIAYNVDFMGLSEHPFYGEERFEKDRMLEAGAYAVDTARSSTLAPNGVYWVTESTGGPNLTSSANFQWSISGDRMRHQIWDHLGSGATKCLYWKFNQRNSWHEGAEETIHGLDDESTPRQEALTEAADIIRANQELFDSVNVVKPDVWILYSESSWIFNQFEQKKFGNDKNNPRNSEFTVDSMAGAYEMLDELGLHINIIDEKRLIAGRIPKDAVLLSPALFSFAPGVLQALDKFVTGGGTLIADHLFAWRDHNGRIFNENKAAADRIFGVTLHDSDPKNSDLKSEEFYFEGCGLKTEGWFFRLLFQDDYRKSGAEIVARWEEDGEPAVFRHKYGNGTAIRIGTAFFHRYFIKPDKTSLVFLKTLLPEKIFGGIKLLNPSYNLRLRELTNGKQSVLIVLNTNEKDDVFAVLKTDEDGTIKALTGGKELEFQAGLPVAVLLKKAEVKQFVFTKKPGR